MFKGKKMAGHMGNKLTTMQNLEIFRIDPAQNLVFVKGSLPGFAGNWVTLSDAFRKGVHYSPNADPPCPTFIGKDGVPTESVTVDLPTEDPFVEKYVS